MSGEGRSPVDREDRGWLTVYSDGGARGNPGPAGIGGRAIDPDGVVAAEVCEYLGETTNNVAEYYGLIRILEEGRDLGYDKVRIRTDSELLANQVKGNFRVKSKALRPLFERTRSILASFRQFEVEHVPREKNIECDTLANRAIDLGLAGRQKPILDGEDRGLF